MTQRYAVFGNPIAHSKSPDIHTAFAAETAQAMQYSKQLVPLDGFDDACTAFFESGGRGLNITVPFKLEAYQYANALTKRARQAGAVNTLIAQADGSILGDNTDGQGIIQDIMSNHGWQIKQRNVVILGAGGAVRGILGPLIEQQPKRILIANRTPSKAKQLATAFGHSVAIEGLGFEELPWHAADIIINGTSASLSDELPPVPKAIVGPNSCCYDMMYGKQLTVFLAWASELGSSQLADGLGMLVEQAAESFYQWRQQRPNTVDVIRQLREEMR